MDDNTGSELLSHGTAYAVPWDSVGIAYAIPWDSVGTASAPGGYCLPGKGTLEFFFLPLHRANFDDLRPLKAKFGTFEHLGGSKTRFREPEIL